MVNKEAFDSLPTHLQVVIENAAAAASVETTAQFDYFNAVAFKSLKEDGVTFGAFPEEVISALKTAVAEVMAENAEANPRFAEVQKSYNAFLELAKDYATAVKEATFTQRV